MNKVFASSREAGADVFDGATILFGGWGLAGNPTNLIRALYEKGVKDIVAISNNPGTIHNGIPYDLATLIRKKRVRKFIGSYHGWNQDFIEQWRTGEIEFECSPQGTMAERIRAAGAGIGGFYTTTGADTDLAAGKERKIINGVEHVLELPLPADFAFVKAKRGDPWGNLIYRYTAQNFNSIMAMAGKVTIAEVEELVELGSLDVNHIHTPGIYVQRIVKGEEYERRV